MRFSDPVEFNSGVQFSQIPEQQILNAPTGTGIISVLNTNRVRLRNTGAQLLNTFTNGQQGQEIKVLGDGFTTAVNSTSIRTNTGANKLLAANRVYTFTLFDASWVENA